MSNVKETTIDGMQDQIYQVLYSTLAIKEKERNELRFFEKNDNEFSNMKAKNSLPSNQKFWLAGLSLDFYNKNGGELFEAGKDGLVEFLNEGTIEFQIGSKNYLDKVPLRHIFTAPNGKADVSKQEPLYMFKFPQAIILAGGMDFYVTVVGKAGAYHTTDKEGFNAHTRMQINLHGILSRPVQ